MVGFRGTLRLASQRALTSTDAPSAGPITFNLFIRKRKQKKTEIIDVAFICASCVGFYSRTCGHGKCERSTAGTVCNRLNTHVNTGPAYPKGDWRRSTGIIYCVVACKIQKPNSQQHTSTVTEAQLRRKSYKRHYPYLFRKEPRRVPCV